MGDVITDAANSGDHHSMIRPFGLRAIVNELVLLSIARSSDHFVACQWSIAAAGRPETGSSGGSAAAAASVGMTASDFHNSAYLSLISEVSRARTARLK